jgi:TrkA domain protein
MWQSACLTVGLAISLVAMSLGEGPLLMLGLLMTAVAGSWRHWHDKPSTPVVSLAQEPPDVPTRKELTMHLERIPLRGVGTNLRFATHAGRWIGVVRHHDGRRELVFYALDDPDTVRTALTLTRHEAHELADALGTHRPTDLAEDLDGSADFTVAHFRVPASSPYSGRPISDTTADRGAPAVGVVAVIRDRQILAGVGPSFVLRPDDVLIAAGTHAGTTALHQLIADDQ